MVWFFRLSSSTFFALLSIRLLFVASSMTIFGNPSSKTNYPRPTQHPMIYLKIFWDHLTVFETLSLQSFSRKTLKNSYSHLFHFPHLRALNTYNAVFGNKINKQKLIPFKYFLRKIQLKQRANNANLK